MKRLCSRAGAFALSSALCLITVGRLSAQTTAAPAAPAKTEDETIVLSPFVVEASEDQGYAAKDTLAGTRVRTELKDVASAISVVTAQFLKDTGAKNSADLLVYTPSTEVAGLRGNFSGVAGTGIYQENTISSTTRVRGLDSADNTRDYFLTDIPWDGFNVGRVDLQRGPNSILFGIGSPAGIINTSVNDASFKNAYNFETRVDQYGSFRNQVNLNQELIKGVLAIRVAAVKDDQLYEQKPAFNNTTRYYGALRLDPKLFGEDNRTSIRVKVEDGKVKSNNPRSIPPGDTITPWFKSGPDAYGNYGLNKLIINQYTTTQATPWGSLAGFTSTLPGGKGGDLATALVLANQTRSFWPDIINYYEGTPQALNNVPNPALPTGTSLKTIAAQPNTGLAVGQSIQGVNPNFLPLAIPQMSTYAGQVQNPDTGTNRSTAPGKPIPGGVYYANVVLQDPSIFNFYKKLLDGPNKHEWQKWNAFNVAFDQSFFNDRFNFEFAYDHQDFTSGALQWMAGENYAINIDINATYADGTPNPNVGRPYAGNGASAPGLNYQNTISRDTFRLTPTFELRTEDFLGNSKWSKILGKHNFTGIYEKATVKQDYVNWAEFATTAAYSTNNSVQPNAANALNSGRSFEWISYLGPNLSSRSSAAGLNLEKINYVIEPPINQSVTSFNSHWNKSSNPSDPTYVDPTAPYTYVNYVTGATQTGTQRDNPANYVGWSTEQVTWMRASNPAEYPSLVESANRSRFRNISTGATWQGYLLGGDLVPTVGWRKDVITSYQTNAFTDPNSGFTSLNYPDDLSSRTDVRGESKSWGGVYHLPKSLTGKLPWGSTVSIFYNRSSNFKADATRLSMAGLPIPNAHGNTKEYGFTITTLNDKLSLKVDWFKTKVANATLADTQGNSIGGLGSNGYFIADGSIWGYAWATSLQEGLRGNVPGSNIWDYRASVSGRYSNSSITTDEQEIAYDLTIVDAWLHAPFPATFFSSYHLTPAIDPTLAAKTGNLKDAYVGGVDVTNGAPPGGGSSFGNHQTTVDNLSQGTEVELTYTPVKNWNITLNYSRVHATHENIDPVSQAFIGAMTKFMNGPGGQVREWFNGGGTLGAQWNASIVAPYTVELNQLGHAAPEVSPWRFNAISTYTFDHGAVKGAFVGAALRMEAGRIIGYHYDPNYKNVNSDDPNYAAVAAVTRGGLNVDQPFIGKNDTHVDAWIGYTRKISRKLSWRIQLNVRSVGESDKLVASRINPDGSIALARIQQGAGYQLTNSFDF